MDKYRENVEFMQRILEANRIPLWFMKPPYEVYRGIDQGLRRDILGFKNLKEHNRVYCESLEKGEMHFIKDIFHCDYVTMLMPDGETVFFCGPMMYERIDMASFEMMFANLGLDERYKSEVYRYYGEIIYVSSQVMLENIFIEFGKALYGDELKVDYEDVSEIEKTRAVYDNMFRVPDKPFSSVEMIEKRYEIENGLLQGISTGNELMAQEYLRKAGESSALYVWRLKDELRDYKNYIITLNSICRKAVEATGIHPIYIDSISNTVVVDIEKSLNKEQCDTVVKRLIQSYCHLVREMNHRTYSPIIQKILAYIDTDLQEDLSLNKFAAHLNVNASYLSTLFSKEVGMSLSEYVNQCRVKYAQLLLTSSDFPIKVIAERCGYQDIHYFCRVFKKLCKLTPKAYRDSQFLPDKKAIHKMKK